MSREKIKVATLAAQSTLVGGGMKLRHGIDGIWGNGSQRAFDTAPSGLQIKTEEAARAYGYGVDQLGVQSSWVSREVLEPIVASAAAATGRSTELAWDFIHLEAIRKSMNGVVMYNAASVSPSGLFHGLMQMGRPAWSDVQAAYRGTPSFMEGRHDAQANVLAGLRYSVLNQRYLVSKGYKGPFTVEVMYSAHNQGAAGFMRLLSTKRANANFNNQSAKAKSVMRIALLANGVALA